MHAAINQKGLLSKVILRLEHKWELQLWVGRFWQFLLFSDVVVMRPSQCAAPPLARQFPGARQSSCVGQAAPFLNGAVGLWGQLWSPSYSEPPLPWLPWCTAAQLLSPNQRFWHVSQEHGQPCLRRASLYFSLCVLNLLMHCSGASIRDVLKHAFWKLGCNCSWGKVV